MHQNDFDLMIGQLDHLLSKLMIASKEELSEANRQTLKHHIEDMELCCEALRKRLKLQMKSCDYNYGIVLQTYPWLTMSHLSTGGAQFYFKDQAVFGIKLEPTFSNEHAEEVIRHCAQGRVLQFLAKYYGTTLDRLSQSTYTMWLWDKPIEINIQEAPLEEHRAQNPSTGIDVVI